MENLNVTLPTIPKITPAAGVDSKGTTGKVTEEIGASFAEILNELSASEMQSDNLLEQLAAGEDVDIHDVMIAAEQTDINFRIAMTMRDKLVDAYSEIMRMQI